MPENIKLLPCPFCGGKASCDTKYPDNLNHGFNVVCIGSDDCGGAAYVGNSFFPTEEAAIKAWNTRHKEQADG